MLKISYCFVYSVFYTLQRPSIYSWPLHSSYITYPWALHPMDYIYRSPDSSTLHVTEFLILMNSWTLHSRWYLLWSWTFWHLYSVYYPLLRYALCIMLTYCILCSVLFVLHTPHPHTLYLHTPELCTSEPSSYYTLLGLHSLYCTLLSPALSLLCTN